MATTTAASANGISNLGQDQFLQLLVAQLRNQDPLDPTDSTTFISQLATFSQLQGVQTLNASFDQMLKLSQLTEGSSLIGKTVEYTPTNGTATTGKVDSLAVQTDGTVQLQIGGASVPLSQVNTVTA